MNNLVFRAAVACVVTIRIAHAQTIPTDLATKLSAIEKTIEAKRVELGVPGAALAIVKDGKVIFSKGFGLRDLEGKLPVTPHTQFAIGSCKKAFTALSAMIAKEQGKIALTDSPKKYLPYFKVGDPYLDSHITLADMLSHRTGMMAYNDVPWATSVLNRTEVIRAMADAKPTSKIGEKFQYNNIMFLAAGECVAASEGLSYEETIRRQIFVPLGMGESNLTSAQMQKSPDHSLGYDITDIAKPRLLPMRNVANISPAGAINSNLTDMAKWIEFMLANGVVDGKRLVTEADANDLVSPHTAISPQISYGYGWVLDSWHGHRQIWHNGGIDGFNSHLAMLPDEHVGFILLTNVSESGLPAATLETVFSNLFPSTETASPTSTPSDADPSKEVGTYHIGPPDKGLDLAISLRDGKMYVHPKGQPEFTMVLVGDHRYTLAEPAPPKVFLTFRATKKDPKVLEVVLEQSGATMIGALVADAKVAFSAPITVEDLLEHVIDAYGGQKALAGHHSAHLAYTFNMENQGVTGEEQRFYGSAGQSATVDQLRAAGRSIGLTHSFFDGKSARDEATFTVSTVHTGKELADARTQSVMIPELEWKTNFKTALIERIDKVGNEGVYVVRLTPEKGSDVVDYVSTTSFKLLKRESAGTVTETFLDYRKVGRVSVPYEIDRDDTNGHTIMKLRLAEFDKPLSRDLFKPGYRHCQP